MNEPIQSAGEAVPETIDPLIAEIRAYREGVAKFNAIPLDQITRENEDQLADEVYQRHENALLNWNQPALTRTGAIEALKLMGESDAFRDDIGEPMRLAVLRYLEAQEGVL